MQEPIISGIQQIGIGIPHVYEAWKWYRKAFGVNVPVFDEAATAALMLPYTGNQPQDRHAVLALNMRGGGGFEIWQYVSRTPQPANFTIELGDYGIYAAKIKSTDVVATFAEMKAKNLSLIGDIGVDPAGKEHFFVADPYGNMFQVVGADTWFSKNKRTTGGAAGAIIGVSNIERARTLYSDILGYDQVIYEETGSFADFSPLPSGKNRVRRVLLTHSKAREGAFSQLLGPSEIELVQVFDRQPNKIFANRFWGDLGFIHLCFDISGMEAMRNKCAAAGFPFTVDSTQANDTFDMGEAAGSFSYIEDPDGTLIEFVETHKIPILKKIGWYLNLRKRNPRKPLPKWMLKFMGFNKVKD